MPMTDIPEELVERVEAILKRKRLSSKRDQALAAIREVLDWKGAHIAAHLDDTQGEG